MVAVALTTLGCREDIGTAPAGVSSSTATAAAQCLAQSTDMTAGGLGVVQSRLASPLLHARSAPGLPPSRTQAVCLSREGGRWHLRPAVSPEVVLE
jgi:hypothetical protein